MREPGAATAAGNWFPAGPASGTTGAQKPSPTSGCRASIIRLLRGTEFRDAQPLLAQEGVPVGANGCFREAESQPLLRSVQVDLAVGQQVLVLQQRARLRQRSVGQKCKSRLRRGGGNR